MTKRPLSLSPAYLQYVRGLHRLHALTVEGRDESPEADAVRDGMDRPWYALSESEQERVGGLSEDLYSLSDPPGNPQPPDPQAARKLFEAAEARRRGEWDRALELLRRWGRHLEPALLSYLRGSLWLDAGDAATATLFLRHATDLQPSDEEFLFDYLSALERSAPDEALRRAREILDDDAPLHPLRMAWAGHLLSKSRRSMDLAGRDVDLQRLGGKLERALTSLENGINNYNNIFILLIESLAYCYRELGDARAAIRHLDAGIAAVPMRPELYLLRGVTRYGSYPGAAEDIARAIQLGFQDVWPYFYLAHHNLVTGRFDECRKMCDIGLDYAAPDEIKAQLHEWRAMARSELGDGAEMVRSDFEEAVRLAPENDEIRQNFETFNRSSGQPQARPHDWSTPRASAIQALYPFESISPLSPAA